MTKRLKSVKIELQPNLITFTKSYTFLGRVYLFRVIKIFFVKVIH